MKSTRGDNVGILSIMAAPGRALPGTGEWNTPAALRERPTVALWLGDKHYLLPQISAECRRRGWQVVDTAFFDGKIPPDVKLQGAFVSALPGSTLVTDLRASGCATVRIGSLMHPDDAALPAVLPDRFARGCVAAEHFAERGFRHVGYMGFDPWGDSRDLFEGFKKTAEERNMQCHLLRDAHTIPRGERAEHRRGIFAEWIKAIPKPVGVLGFDDKIAVQFCGWTMWSGLRIPVDVSIMGVGNDANICENTLPQISSVDINPEIMASRACDLLELQMTGEPTPPEPVMIGPRGVVTRESTDVLATSDNRVAKALRYMWSNLDINLSVDEIASKSGVNRRQLERAFRRELGRGINEELRRKRLETFTRLLLSTDRPISKLCILAGFPSKDYLHRVFKREYGMTPHKYRIQQI